MALPKGVHLNHVAFSALEERAARINMAGKDMSVRVNYVMLESSYQCQDLFEVFFVIIMAA